MNVQVTRTNFNNTQILQLQNEPTVKIVTSVNHKLKDNWLKTGVQELSYVGNFILVGRNISTIISGSLNFFSWLGFVLQSLLVFAN